MIKDITVQFNEMKKGEDLSMKYDNTSTNVSAIYIGSLVISSIVFAGMYFLMSSVFSEYVYFVKFREILDMSVPLFTYLMAINFTTILMYFYDKSKAITGLGMRVPEMILHLLEALGGSLSALLAQNIFRHKKRKVSFYKITWMIIVVQATFLALPWILQLPGDRQMMVFIALPIVLVGLYFLDILKSLMPVFTLILYAFIIYYVLTRI